MFSSYIPDANIVLAKLGNCASVIERSAILSLRKAATSHSVALPERRRHDDLPVNLGGSFPGSVHRLMTLIHRAQPSTVLRLRKVYVFHHASYGVLYFFPQMSTSGFRIVFEVL